MGIVAATTELVKALAEFAWPAMVGGIVYWFRRPLLAVLDALKHQIDRGASLKYGGLELIGVTLESFSNLKGSRFEKVDADPELVAYRQEMYREQRDIFLVHRVQKANSFSEKGYQLYDMSIYLTSHKDRGNLEEINFVEYQFGESRDQQFPNGTRYILRDSANGFAIRRMGSGPTPCAARINFRDGKTVVVNRYLDFENTGFAGDPRILEKKARWK